MVLTKNCLNCKYAKIENNFYCFCKKKQNRKQISKMGDCEKWDFLVSIDRVKDLSNVSK